MQLFSLLSHKPPSLTPRNTTKIHDESTASNAKPELIARCVKSASPSPIRWNPEHHLTQAQQSITTGMTTCQPKALFFNKNQFVFKKKEDIDPEIAINELRDCVHSQQTKPCPLAQPSAEAERISPLFEQDLTRNIYVINGKIISQPGTELSIARMNLRTALTSNGKLDHEGLYAISNFANQSVLALPLIRMTKMIEKEMGDKFYAHERESETRFDITSAEGEDIQIRATHTRKIDKATENVDHDIWTQLGKNSYSTLYTDIHLNPKELNNFDSSINDNPTTTITQSRTGYEVHFEKPPSYLEILTAMSQKSREDLFFSYIDQANRVNNASEAYFKATVVASMNVQLELRIESPTKQSKPEKPVYSDDEMLAKDIFIILLNDRLTKLRIDVPGLEQDKPLTATLVKQVAAYMQATFPNISNDNRKFG
jgi:hypothetical protein